MPPLTFAPPPRHAPMKTNPAITLSDWFFAALQLSAAALLLFGAFAQYQGIPNGLIDGKAYFFVVAAASLLVVWAVRFGLAPGPWVVFFNAIDAGYAAYVLFVAANCLARQRVADVELTVQVLSLFVYGFVKNAFSPADANNRLSIGVILLFLLAGLAQAAYGLLQLYGYYPSLHAAFKLTGSFHNPGPFAVFLVPCFVFALGLYLQDKTLTEFKTLPGLGALYPKLRRYVCLAVCIAVVLVLPATQSRTAWVAFAASTALLLGCKYNIGEYWNQLKSRTLRIFALAFAAMLVLALFLGLAYKFKAASAAGRLVTWETGLRMVADAPLFGQGFGNFANRHGNYQAAYFATHPNETGKIMVADKVEYAFNDYLQILIEQGIVGFALFSYTIFAVFKSIPWRRLPEQPLLLAALAGWVAVLVGGLFSYPFELAPTWLNFVFLLGIISARLPSRQINVAVSRPISVLLAVLLVAASSWIMYHQNQLLTAKQQWLAADQSMQYGSYAEAVEMYAKVDSVLPHEGTMLLGYGKALLLAGNTKQGINVLERAKGETADPFLYTNLGEGYQKLKQYSLAEQAYLHASHMIPNRLYPKYLLAKMHLEKGDTLKARGMAQKIVDTKEKIESSATRQMKEEMRKVASGTLAEF